MFWFGTLFGVLLVISLRVLYRVAQHSEITDLMLAAAKRPKSRRAEVVYMQPIAVESSDEEQVRRADRAAGA